jgi:CBS-domain-containing membrane protein
MVNQPVLNNRLTTTLVNDPCSNPEERAPWVTTAIKGYICRLCHDEDPDRGPHLPTPGYIVFSFVGSFAGLFVLGMMHNSNVFGTRGQSVITSFGAQAVLLYGAPRAPFAQPWNAVFGNSISGVIGVCCKKFFALHTTYSETFQGAFAVSLAIVARLLTGSTFRPGGATALTAVVGADWVRRMCLNQFWSAPFSKCLSPF